MKCSAWLARWGPVVACMGALFYLSSIPDEAAVPGLERLQFGDKVQHGIAYGVLAALIWRALGGWRNGLWRLGLTVAAAVTYGLTDEAHQLLVPGREFQLSDLAANFIGALAAAGALAISTGGDKLDGRQGAEDLRGEGQTSGEP